MIAAMPIHWAMSLSVLPATIRAPISVIPEIALAPDIRGVWRVGGTLDISSKPIKLARTKTNRLKMNGLMTISSISQFDWLRVLRRVVPPEAGELYTGMLPCRDPVVVTILSTSGGLLWSMVVSYNSICRLLLSLMQHGGDNLALVCNGRLFDDLIFKVKRQLVLFKDQGEK